MTIREKCALAQKASPALAQADAKTRNGAILKMAQYLRESADELLAANETDMRSAGVNGVPEAMLDPATMIPLAAAISRVENGTAADRGEIERGWALFSD